MRTPRLLATALAVAALALPPVASADTAAVATNTRDGTDIFRLAFQIRHVMGDTVDQTNAAVAYASCDACQTTAISIQVLLIGGDPSTFTPENYAIAMNENCTFCDTLASAYQFATGTGTPLHFSAEGNRRIADIRRQLQQLRGSGLSGPEIQAQVDTLMDDLANVLQTEVVAVGGAAPEPQPSENATPPEETGTTGTTPDEATPTDTGTTETTPPPTTSTTPETGTTTAP